MLKGLVREAKQEKNFFITVGVGLLVYWLTPSDISLHDAFASLFAFNFLMFLFLGQKLDRLYNKKD